MGNVKPSAYDLDLSKAEWRCSPDSADEDALEVAYVARYIAMRNSADPDGPVFVFTCDEWDAFVAGVTDGEFDFDDSNEGLPG